MLLWIPLTTTTEQLIMSSAAMKLECQFSDPDDTFSANLEDGSDFVATLTELKSATTPGRGDVWVVIATDRNNNSTKTFTINFAKDSEDTIGKITDNDDEVSLFYNNYEDLDNPTLQKARTGTIQYTLDTNTMTFVGSFNAEIDKADGSGAYMCSGHFNTTLSR